MAALSQALKCGIGKNVSQAVNTQCIRSFVVSTNQKSSSGSSKKGNGSSGLSAVPRNIQEINSSIKAKFSPHRARDKTSARTDPKVLQRSGTVSKEFMGSQGSKEGIPKQNTKLNTKSTPKDSHVAVYDGSNSVSLSSVMQSTVPQPYNINGKKAPAHFNMPGGQWAQGEKYVSGDLHAHHSRNIPKKYQGTMVHPSLALFGTLPPVRGSNILNPSSHRLGTTNLTQPQRRGLRSYCLVLSPSCLANCVSSGGRVVGVVTISVPAPFLHKDLLHPSVVRRCLSTSPQSLSSEKGNPKHEPPPTDGEQGEAPSPAAPAQALTQRERLKRAAKDYGATVVVFHVTISLMSLGFFYMLVSSGIDMSAFIEKLGINLANLEQEELQKLSTSAVEEKAGDDPHQEAAQPSLSSTSPTSSNGGQKAVAVAAGVSTFVLSYAIHKVFAPVRIAITLTATPFIVRHLRKIGFLKTPATAKTSA